MKAHNGTEIRAGQKWLSADDHTYLVVGVSVEGLPVLEGLDGPKFGEFFSVEKYWKSYFLRAITDCKHQRTTSGHCGAIYCSDCGCVLR